MTRPCPGPDYAFRAPKIIPPPKSCGTQAHVFGPADRFHYADGCGYTPPDAATRAQILVDNPAHLYGFPA